MGIEQQIIQAVEQAVKNALKGLEMPQNGKDEDCLLTTKQASVLFVCSAEYIRNLQDKGILKLRFLPGSKERRVLKSELMELMAKSDRIIKK